MPIRLYRKICAADANTHYVNGEQFRIVRPTEGPLAGFTVVDVGSERTAQLVLSDGGGWRRYVPPAVLEEDQAGEVAVEAVPEPAVPKPEVEVVPEVRAVFEIGAVPEIEPGINHVPDVEDVPVVEGTPAEVILPPDPAAPLDPDAGEQPFVEATAERAPLGLAKHAVVDPESLPPVAASKVMKVRKEKKK